ncbi:MAG: hypothetical protein PUC65_13920 [Clostridiales bacterium]|nr:hypothetical protein [Clostridiales bacterium]
MLVLIKPLIFIESQKLTIEELKKYVKPILSLSLSLAVVGVALVSVLFTVIVPQMPLTTVLLLVYV